MIEFILNDKTISTDKPSGYLLLDLIRYDKSLTGTKIGCREGDCGACTVLIGSIIDGQLKYINATSCLTPIGNIQGKHIVTIEGLNMEDLSPVQEYMIQEDGTQCGFCTVGFVVSLSGFCLSNKNPTYQDAIKSIDGNICRCTGYKSIERAANHITEALNGKDTTDTISWLVNHKFIPSYFVEIKQRLEKIEIPEPTSTGDILVGGGTDLYVQQPDSLVVKNISTNAERADLRSISIANGICTLGGATTVTDLSETSKIQSVFPHLWEHIKLVSSSPIRNISTLAGNFVNASPIGDLTAFFLALDAKITLSEGDQNRTIYLKDFYNGYKDLDKNGQEIISTISFNMPSANSHFNLEKVSKRIHLDIASVNSAALIEVENNVILSAQISAGGVGPIPTFLTQTCEFLKGQSLSNETIRSAAGKLQSEISPISDVRGTVDYKRLLIRQLFYAHFIKLFPLQIKMKELR